MGKCRYGMLIASGVVAVNILSAGSASAQPVQVPPTLDWLCYVQPTIKAIPGEPTHGTSGKDHILGTPGDDEIYGEGGNDLICGVGGNDYIAGDDGGDTILGGPGNDQIWLVDRTKDTADGGSGHDVVTKDWDPIDTVRNAEDVR